MQHEIHHSLKMSLKSPNSSFPSKEGSLSSPTSPSYIIDHCDTFKSNDPPIVVEENQAKGKGISKKKGKKVFPPPITSLARTQNQASHMPWILKRYYTSEGRLILKEEKKKHHGYFRAHRSNGRLTLKLVPFDDDNDTLMGTNAQVAATSHHYYHEKNKFAGEKNMTNIVANDELHVENNNSNNKSNNNGVVDDTNGGLKSLKFNNVRSAPSCIFGVPLHPIRTIHS